MKKHSRSGLVACGVVLVAACTSDPDGVIVELAPEVVSSIDGTTTVRMMVIAERTPVSDQAVALTIDYTDRNGTAHPIAPVSGKTDARGAFEAVVAGLDWEGTGTVTAAAVDGTGAPLMAGGAALAADATFAVLDRTPPQVEILPPTTDLHVGAGLPLDVQVRVRDEIGVSEVFIEASGELDRLRSTVVASGSTDAILTFRFDVPDNAQPGPTITLHALAADLSGNLSAAAPIVLIVDPAIAIATPPGLAGSLVVNGSDQVLVDPRALAVSPRDGALYVADNAGNTPCNGACIRRIDPATGAVDPAAVITGVGTMEGVAFDASGDNLYFTDRQNRIGRLTWNPGTQRYDGAGFCNDISAQNPADPYHLVVDPTLGLLVVDDDRQRVARQATCNNAAQPSALSTGGLNQPRGIALGPTGEIYVSDLNDDRIYQVSRASGAVTTFAAGNLDQPWGIEWLGGTSAWANSLLVALNGDRIVVSVGPAGHRITTYLRNVPIDVALAGGTAYVLTEPSAGNRGRIFRVTGF